MHVYVSCIKKQNTIKTSLKIMKMVQHLNSILKQSKTIKNMLQMIIKTPSTQ